MIIIPRLKKRWNVLLPPWIRSEFIYLNLFFRLLVIINIGTFIIVSKSVFYIGFLFVPQTHLSLGDCLILIRLKTVQPTYRVNA
ncbi:hypothetical protein THF1D04_50183 [Vibrio owensii]|uniref:Uncharacterized protein n=1 Tax=Vibrio owensii TaxID=696485 RepID=A0AAU9Q9X2_9VIBR|nr:hypothetical protein THF1D04_50183 [Vibrio owensii]